MGNPFLPFFFLAVPAHQVPLDPAFCKLWITIRHDFHIHSIAQGVFVCVAGLGLLVASDELTKKDYTPVSRAKGDCFIIAAATIYGFSEYSTFFPGSLIISNKLANATEEFFVRKRPLYEASQSISDLKKMKSNLSRSLANLGCGAFCSMAYNLPLWSGDKSRRFHGTAQPVSEPAPCQNNDNN